MSSRHGSEKPVQILIRRLFDNVWQDVEYRFDVARDTRGVHIELH
jgi:hypothetical protein